MKIIGLSGLAGAGKDLFYDLCSEELKKRSHIACSLALASELKKECMPTIKTMFNIDPTSCSREEKDKIRNYLVFFGHFRRKETKGQYWMVKANNKIKSLKRNCTINNVINPICFITDVRYDEYPSDEVSWVQNHHSGLLVHLRKRQITISELGKRKDLYEEAINTHERENDPKIRRKADVCIEWPNCRNDKELIKKYLKPVVMKFIDQHITPKEYAQKNMGQKKS
jgi:hypothetical protein